MGFRGVALKGARWVVWLFLAWVCLRGVVSIVLPPPVRETVSPPAKMEPAEPEEREGPMAFAVLFAREYLTWAGGEKAVQDRAERLKPFLASQVDGQAGWAPGEKPAAQTVTAALPYRLERVANDRWLVTVAATVTVQGETPVSRSVWLAVPVAGGKGQFVVYDLPTRLAPPKPAVLTGPALAGAEIADEGGQVRTLLNGFFRAYVAGNDGDMSYFLVPGLKVNSLHGSLVYKEVTELSLRRSGTETLAAAVVTMEDPVGGALLRSRYTLKVEQRDGRWYIKEIIEKGA
jgi:hypothetical protein